MVWIKYVCLVVVLMAYGAVSNVVDAQTLKEWFNQKKTQKQYLIEQIAALKVYGDCVWKGYELVGEGLDVVGWFTGQERADHGDFFASLRQVSSAVKGDSRVKEIVAMLEAMERFLLLPIEGSGEYAGPIDGVRAQLKKACRDDLAEMEVLLNSGDLEMKEAGRLSRIAALHGRMLERLGFALRFRMQLQGFSRFAEKEHKELDLMKGNYGVLE
jgi:hypothetical protein